ncbi:gamma-glutamylcyclotransferase [Albimonas sp. CAU 1670]|uniref:NUDIX domain-containing protein n=1 Tax=Albimonas sp. CAU 1670 TaxID=3032599 RepID=UPI0023DC7B26|nr:NUDIX domain-containing protein [Albimonas sp. CAU 1670]MDF2231340.1 gamma-glutamylcyclotransferase [Albimonas sp. CAU 1670]
MAGKSVFFYGSLRDPELAAVVLGRPFGEVPLRPARLPGHAVRQVAGENFPCVVPLEGAEAEGALACGLSEAEVARVAFFEDDEEYELRPLPVRADDGALREALVCFPKGPTTPDGPWRFEDWTGAERDLLIECAREIMALYEAGVDWSDLTLWPGLKARAAARARAGRAPSAAFPGVDFRREAVRTERLDRPYASFFGVEEHFVSFPTSDGGRSPVVRRAVWASGDAATVLPYDAKADRVLLATQWRAGPHARGDARPWPWEVIAGRLDAVEDPEEAARREALEEAGVTLGRIEKAGGYYTSPGTLAEFVTSFVGEADLSAAGGAGGLEEEAEDVISAVLDFDAAMAAVDAGEVNSSPAVISLLWLARHRARLRAEWG